MSSSIQTVLERSPLEEHSSGSLSLAVIAVILGRQTHDPAWNRKWGSFFQAAFVLNFGALLFLLPLVALFAIADPLMSGGTFTRKAITAFLVADFLCCAFALKAWRRLMSL